MNALCKRAQDGMYLMLIICMSWAWVLFSESHSSVLEDARILGDFFLTLEMDTTGIQAPTLPVEQLVGQFEGPRGLDGGLIKLSTILDITDSEMMKSRPQAATIAALALRAGSKDYERSISRVYDAKFLDAQKPLERLRSTIAHTQLPIETASVNDLQRTLSLSQVEIPYVHGRVSVSGAFWTLGIAAAILTWYVFALVDSIALVRSRGCSASEDVLDMILLLPSWLASAIGTVWVFIPAGLCVVGLFGGRYRVASDKAEWACVFVLLCVSVAGAFKLLLRAKAIRSSTGASLD